MALVDSFLDSFSFEVRNVASGEVRPFLDVDAAAEFCGEDPIDFGAALEWYSEIAVPTSADPRFTVRRIELSARPS